MAVQECRQEGEQDNDHSRQLEENRTGDPLEHALFYVSGSHRQGEQAGNTNSEYTGGSINI